MSEKLLQKLKLLVEEEVQKQLSQFAHLVAKRHDISLKLLIQDVQSFQSGELATIDEESSTTCGQCMGVTAKKKRCSVSGKYGGYCYRHKGQMKKTPSQTSVGEGEIILHVGHTLKEKMFLAGCPACERVKKSSQQNLLIDI